MTSALNAISATNGGIHLRVHAQPGAKRTEVSGLHGDAIKIRVHARPVDGRANDELIRFIAEIFGLPRSQVDLIRGETSREKTFSIIGVTAEQARQLLDV